MKKHIKLFEEYSVQESESKPLFKSYIQELLEGASALKETHKELQIFTELYIAFKHDKYRGYLLHEMLKTVDNAELILNILQKEYGKNISIQLIDGPEYGKYYGFVETVIPIENMEIIPSLQNRMNTLGWYPALYWVEDDNEKTDKHKTLDSATASISKDDTKISIMFEPKYDVEIDISSCEYLYHITFDIHYDKIMTNGVTPRTQSKLGTHPNRIYFITDKYLIKSLAELLYNNNKNNKLINKAIVFKIDVSKLVSRNIKFYADVNTPHSVYTNDNIPSEFLEVYKEINLK